MGQDHPITWCKLYDGDNVNDNTGTPKSYSDGRTWVTVDGPLRRLLHREQRQQQPDQADRRRRPLGRGRGPQVRLLGHRLVLVHAQGPRRRRQQPDRHRRRQGRQGLLVGDRQPDQRSSPTGYIKMHDPAKPAGNKTTVVSIPTRADHGNSEDGVLGMSLQPGFDLDRPDQAQHLRLLLAAQRRHWPMTGNAQVVGYNQISRFTLTADGTAVVPGSERVILRVPKAKISGSPSGFPGGPTNSGPGHVGGAGLDFDSAGNLYLGVGDDVSPSAPGHNGYAPMDYRAEERWDARKTSQNSADLRGKIIRITPKQGDIPADAEPGVDATYDVPAGNLFPVGTAKTRPEIYAMGFRQPFTVHTDPANPGIVGMGEYCHDNSANAANRSPAGTCEWNLINKAGNHGWPFCVGNNSTANTMFRWNYATPTRRPASSTTATLAHAAVRHPLRAGGPDPGRADARRPGHAARPGREGDDLEEVQRRGRRPEHGRLRQPRRRRHAAARRPDLPLPRDHGQPGRVPALLRRLVADQQPRLGQRLLEGSPDAQGQQPDAARQRLAALQRRRQPERGQLRPRHRHAVRPRRRAVHGALLGRLLPRRTSASQPEPDREDLVQRPGRVPDRHERAERLARGDRPGLPGPPEHLRQHRQAQADGDGLRLRRREEHRVPPAGLDGLAAVHGRRHVRRGQDLHGRVPRDRPQGQRRRGQDGHVRGPQDQRHDAPRSPRPRRRATRTSATTSSAPPRSR